MCWLGGNYVDIGLISATGAVIRIIPTFIGGYLADSIGRKKIVFTMTFLLAFNELVNAFAPGYQVLFLSAALGALWGGLREPSFSSILADSTTPENRALAYAVWNVVPPLFGLASPYVIGVLMDRYGVVVAMRWAYLSVFGMGSIAAFIRYRFLEETLVLEEKEKIGLRTALREVLEDFRVTFKALPRQLWVFLGIDFIFTFAWSLIDPYFVTYAKEKAGVSAAQWGFITMLVTLISIAVRLPAATASDRYGRLKFILPTLLLYPVTIYLFANSRSYQAVLVIRAVIAVLSSVDTPAWQALFVDYSPREHRGRFNAVASVSWSLIWSAGNVVGGTLYQEFSKKTPFLVGSAFLLCGAIAAFLFIREPERREI